MRHIKQQGSFQKYHLFSRHKRANYNFTVHFEQFGRTFVKFNCFLKARLNPVFNIQTPTMHYKLHLRTKYCHQPKNKTLSPPCSRKTRTHRSFPLAAEKWSSVQPLASRILGE